MKALITIYTENLRFEWKGGEYIEVINRRHIEDHDLINVWDYEAGKPRIPFTPEAMFDTVEDWLDENAEDEVAKTAVVEGL